MNNEDKNAPLEYECNQCGFIVSSRDYKDLVTQLNRSGVHRLISPLLEHFEIWHEITMSISDWLPVKRKIKPNADKLNIYT